jgi:hypothetical protein
MTKMQSTSARQSDVQEDTFQTQQADNVQSLQGQQALDLRKHGSDGDVEERHHSLKNMPS